MSYIITPRKNYFRFYGRHIGLPETVEDAIKMASGSPNIFRKSHKGAPLTPSGSAVVVKRSAWGNLFPFGQWKVKLNDERRQ